MSTLTHSWPRALVVAALCAVALGQGAACSSPAGPTSGPCTVETLVNGSTTVPANTFLVQPITLAKNGRLDVSVDWATPTNIVSGVLAQAPCSPDDFRADHCNVILNLFPPPKPLAGSTYWLAPGPYDLLIGNFGPIEDTATTKVVLRSTGCPAPGRE